MSTCWKDKTPAEIIADVNALLDETRKQPGVVDLSDPNVRLVAKPDGKGGVIILADPAKA